MLRSRWFLLIVVSALLATGLVFFTGRFSTARRLSNLGLEIEGIPDAYLMISKSLEQRGYLVDRRDSTVRRSRVGLPGKRWNLERFGAPDHWLLRSKQAGTIFFVPVDEVPDLSYPFYYGFVRSELEESGLPLVTWTQLYVNRVYSGLYLRVELPVDPRKKDGRAGLLRELLMVRGDRMALVDTRFNRDGRLYAECVSNGIFPELVPPPPAVLWLAGLDPSPETTFLLSNAEPFELTLLPLPVSLADLYEKLQGSPLPRTVDERFGEWTAPLATGSPASASPFGEDRRRRLERALADYRRSLGAALGAHTALHDTELTAQMAALLETDDTTLPQ